MDYKQILKVILDIGEQMINSGAEISRVEDSMYRLCRSYGFTRVNCWVISSNIQATVETPEGDIFTQIRHVPGGEMNFDRLDYLNNLSRYICTYKPDIAEMREKYLEVMNRQVNPLWLKYLSGIMVAGGFTIFFGGSIFDGLISSIVSILIINLLGNLKFALCHLDRSIIIIYLVVEVIKIGVGVTHHQRIAITSILLCIF